MNMSRCAYLQTHVHVPHRKKSDRKPHRPRAAEREVARDGGRERERERERGREREGGRERERERERGRQTASQPDRQTDRQRQRVVCWLLNVPAACWVYLRDGSAKTILSAATLT